MSRWLFSSILIYQLYIHNQPFIQQYTVKHLILVRGFLFDAIGSPKYVTANYRFEYKPKKWTHNHSIMYGMLVNVSINQLLNRKVCFDIEQITSSHGLLHVHVLKKRI